MPRLPTGNFSGNKEALYSAARQEYFLSVEDSSLAGKPEDFIHTEKVTLLDQQRRIRGYYDATDSTSIIKLIADTKQLLK